MGTYRRIKGQKNRQNQTGKLLCGPPGFFLAACLCRYIPRWPGINPALPASGAQNALPGPEKDAVSGRRRPFSRFDSSYLNRLTGRTVRVIIKIVFEPSLLRLCSYGALAAPGSRFRVPPETAAPSVFEKETRSGRCFIRLFCSRVFFGRADFFVRGIPYRAEAGNGPASLIWKGDGEARGRMAACLCFPVSGQKTQRSD